MTTVPTGVRGSALIGQHATDAVGSNTAGSAANRISRSTPTRMAEVEFYSNHLCADLDFIDAHLWSN